MNIHRLNVCLLSLPFNNGVSSSHICRTQVYVVLEWTVAIKSGVVSVSDKYRKFSTDLNS
jgi:hypothetical protein